MPTCGSPSCACNTPVYSGPGNPCRTDRTSDRYLRGQAHTIWRLIRRTPGLSFEARGGHHWLFWNGYVAPVVVGHGHVSFRTKEGRHTISCLESASVAGAVVSSHKHYSHTTIQEVMTT